MTSAPLQRTLPFRVQLRLPMLDIAGVRAALGVSEDDVIGLIDDGALAWAFDISTKEAKKREVRVLARCVQKYQDNGTTDHGPLTFDQVVAIVFPQTVAREASTARPWLWGREIVHAFNCGSEHVFNLLREGSLKLLPGHVLPGRGMVARAASTAASTGGTQNLGWRRGPGGMPCVASESAVEFLKTRRMSP